MIPAPPANIAALLSRPVAVLGAGVSGHGVLALLTTLGARGILYDEKADGAQRSFEAPLAAGHDLVVFSPGFAPEHPWLATARAAGCTCVGELDFACVACHQRVEMRRLAILLGPQHSAQSLGFFLPRSEGARYLD